MKAPLVSCPQKWVKPLVDISPLKNASPIFNHTSAVNGKQALILGAAQGLDEGGKVEDLDVGGAVVPVVVAADDYVAAG
jgi:hypothetical protein